MGFRCAKVASSSLARDLQWGGGKSILRSQISKEFTSLDLSGVHDAETAQADMEVPVRPLSGRDAYRILRRRSPATATVAPPGKSAVCCT
jgi:hypothetical protein